MNLKANTEYIFKTGNTISDDGTIPLKQMQEIVRCKDCEYGYLWMNDGTGKIGKCAFLIGYNQYVPAEGFCNLGERKVGAKMDEEGKE